MASGVFTASSQEEHTFLQSKLTEFQLEKQEQERAVQESNAFIGRSLITSRYPLVGVHFSSGDFPKVLEALGEDEHSHLSSLKHTYHGTMSRLFLSPDKPSSDLGGFAMVLKRDSSRIHSVELLDDKAPFAFTMIIPITSESLQTSGVPMGDLRRAVEGKVREFLKGLPTQSPSIRTHFSPGKDIDAASWDTFFPTNKAFAGVYIKDGQLYLASCTHAGETIRDELNDLFVGDQIDATMFVNSQVCAWVKSMSRRNCARVLFGLANALGVTIPHMIDGNAFVRPHCEPPRCAIPELSTHYNTCRSTDTKQPIFFRRCADAEQSTGRHLLVQSDHVRGLAAITPTWEKTNDCEGMFPISTSVIPKDKRLPWSVDYRKRKSRQIFFLNSDDEDYARNMQHFSRESFKKTSYRHLKGALGISDGFTMRYRPVYICVTPY